jgi:hypothetical protein
MTNFEKWLKDKDDELFSYYLEGKKHEEDEEDEEDEDEEDEDEEDEEDEEGDKKPKSKNKSGKKTDEDGDGIKGTAKDYLIARFKKGGMPHKEAIEKAKKAVDKKKS